MQGNLEVSEGCLSFEPCLFLIQDAEYLLILLSSGQLLAASTVQLNVMPGSQAVTADMWDAFNSQPSLKVSTGIAT